MNQKTPSPKAPVAVSFEFFPPKSAEAETQLWNAIHRLAPLSPSFVSVTYGAGGSTRDRTHSTVKRLVDETNLTPAAHLTCVGATRDEVRSVIRDYWSAGVRHIVALRGDMPVAGEPYRAHPDGFQTTAELVEAIRAIAPFEVSVSAYPEKHPDTPTLERDVSLLKEKSDAGASRAITQFAFDTDALVRFRDVAAKSGVTIPIVPGLMPTTNFKGVQRMSVRCGASVPKWLADLYEGLEDDLESRKLVAAMVLAEQVERLRAEGFAQFHFYTLNQAELTFAVCNRLGIKPARKPVSV
jgi:methylenetetrahydrofolate reductase (NADPH)